MRIVLIEDNKDLQMAWRYFFNKTPHITTSIFTSGEEALDSFSLIEEADLIITDYHLGEINGLELIRFIKKSCPDKICFFFTGIDCEKLQSEMKSVPHCHLFLKPVAMDHIKSKIKELFE